MQATDLCTVFIIYYRRLFKHYPNLITVILAVVIAIVVNCTFIGYMYMLAEMLLLYPCLYAKLL